MKCKVWVVCHLSELKVGVQGVGLLIISCEPFTIFTIFGNMFLNLEQSCPRHEFLSGK